MPISLKDGGEDLNPRGSDMIFPTRIPCPYRDIDLMTSLQVVLDPLFFSFIFRIRTQGYRVRLVFLPSP